MVANSLMAFFGAHTLFTLSVGTLVGGSAGVLVNHYVRPLNPTTNYHAAKDLQKRSK